MLYVSIVRLIKKIMLWLFGILIVFICFVIFMGIYLSAPRYNGPVSDHFDGKTFKNPGGIEAKGFFDVIKWMTSRKRGEWQPRFDIPYRSPPPTYMGQGIRLTFVNHSTFLIQVDGLNILTDPIWSERASPFSWFGPKRMRPPGIQFEDLPPIDVVLISHNHYDHLDMPTINRLEKIHKPKFYVPLGVGAFLKKYHIDNVTEMDWWQEKKINGKVTLACVPAQHFSSRGMFDRDATLWCGYVIKQDSGNIYFAGDTGYGNFFKTIGERYSPIELALIPIGAYVPQWFMSPIHVSPSEAVQIHLDVNAKKSIAMHFGTFPLADDGMLQPVADLKKALKSRGLSDNDFMALTEGQGVHFK